MMNSCTIGGSGNWSNWDEDIIICRLPPTKEKEERNSVKRGRCCGYFKSTWPFCVNIALGTYGAQSGLASEERIHVSLQLEALHLYCFLVEPLQVYRVTERRGK